MPRVHERIMYTAEDYMAYRKMLQPTKGAESLQAALAEGKEVGLPVKSRK